jgi:hypothetical protein
MANHDWIVDVLSDVQRYSQKNSLRRLSAVTNILIELARLDLTDDARKQGYPVPAREPRLIGFPKKVISTPESEK